VKEIMQTTALLEIKRVQAGPYSSRQQGLQAHNGILPPGTELMESVERPEGAQVSAANEWYLVGRVPAITGRDLRNARPGRDENNRPEVDFTLSADGARRFGEFTESNIGSALAVVLDGKIQSVATIQSRITDSGRITGRFSQQRANDLSLVLRAGAPRDGALVARLQEHVKRVTAPYKYPRAIEFAEELPKTVSGKIRRVELRQKEQRGSGQKERRGSE